MRPAYATTSGAATAARTDTPQPQPELDSYFSRVDARAPTEEGAQVAEIVKDFAAKGDAEAVLNISGRKLRGLPPLPASLKKLKADKNELSSMPENHLPGTLEALDVHLNQRTSLPETLPIANLRLLNAAHNKLDELPRDRSRRPANQSRRGKCFLHPSIARPRKGMLARMRAATTPRAMRFAYCCFIRSMEAAKQRPIAANAARYSAA